MKRILVIIGCVVSAVSAMAQTQQDNAIAPQGKIGIGTLNPQVELEVDGQMKLTPMSDVSLLATELRYLMVTKDGVIVPGELIRQIVDGGGGNGGNPGTPGTPGTPSPCIAPNINWKVDANNNVFLCPADNYKVGIGTVNPTTPLHVNGIIYSEAGGYKFPDNTVQTTAYSPDDFVFAGGQLTIPGRTLGPINIGTGGGGGGSQWTDITGGIYLDASLYPKAGIGTTTLDEALNVAGSTKLTGHLKLASATSTVNFNNGASTMGLTASNVFRHYVGGNSYRLEMSGNTSGQTYAVRTGGVDYLQVLRTGEVLLGNNAIAPAGYGVGLSSKVYSSDDIVLSTDPIATGDGTGLSQKIAFENKTGTDADVYMARWFGPIGNEETRINIGGDPDAQFAIGVGSGFNRKFTVKADGKVGINTNNIPADYTLAVGGKIVCEEVLVDLQVDWPDYVFADDYKLKTLDEVEDYIVVNKHLPGVPSAKEVGEEGMAVGEMNKILLEKVEELTLYMIELKKENEEMKKMNEQLETRLTDLESNQ